MPDQHQRHPSSYSAAQLRVERLGVTQQFIALKRESRQRAAELTVVEAGA